MDIFHFLLHEQIWICMEYFQEYLFFLLEKIHSIVHDKLCISTENAHVIIKRISKKIKLKSSIHRGNISGKFSINKTKCSWIEPGTFPQESAEIFIEKEKKKFHESNLQ